MFINSCSNDDNLLIEDQNIKEICADDLDMIVLPGGWGGTHKLAQDQNLQTLLQQMNEKKKFISAICAAPFALNSAGVLSQNYTCYPSVEEQIRKEGYSCKEMVVEDGNIITSRGPATAMCFALYLVEKLCGKEKSQALKEGLLATYC